MIKWFLGIFIVSMWTTIGDGQEINQLMLAQCCTQGEQLAERQENCSTNVVPESTPREHLSLCMSSTEICCSNRYRKDQCQAGIDAAKTGDYCTPTLDATGSQYFQDCCEACKIGILLSGQCGMPPFLFGNPFDETVLSCCADSGGDTFILTEGEEQNLCERFDKLCSQICENTIDSYVCKCHDGYQLLEDRVSCGLIPNTTMPQIDEDDDNEDEDESSECARGHKMDDSTGKCVDIDECETGDATCDLETEVCYNTKGSFKCLTLERPNTGTCQSGYRLNMKTGDCDDINECFEEISNCSKLTQVCLNTRGSYSCQNIISEQCLIGFRYDPVFKSCQDVNECEEVNNCEAGTKCVNTLGSYECIKTKTRRPSSFVPSRTIAPLKCNAGFKQVGSNCIDIDECVTDRDACDSNQICTNEPGGYKCDCKIGFVLDPVTNACVDVNECQINNHDCLESQRCDNTIGSYTCIRLQSCGTGYTLNAQTTLCDDDDECVLGTHNCVPPYECRNTKGSFRCDRHRPTTTTTTPMPTTPPPPPTTERMIYRTRATQSPAQSPSHHHNPHHQPHDTMYNRYVGPCNPGFERNSQGACTDIDECEYMNPCTRNQKCINTNGSYKCQNLITCPGGYMSNREGNNCIDIDECKTGEANCGSNQMCRNKPGGYICSCPPGHIANDQKQCEDIDECKYYASEVCPVHSECLNTIGSYRCECKSGFKKNREEDKTCIDVDECNEISGLCAQRCINYWGSYRCACDTGYRLSDNNRTCEDIDECEVHKSYNLCTGICENTQGSYRCVCPPGYQLGVDGRTCQDIDECKTQPVCRNYNEVCTNIRGSYKCNRIQCPPEYEIDSEKKNRCKRYSSVCNQGDYECFHKPLTYTWHFISLVSNMSVPPQGRTLFTLHSPVWYENIDFEMKVANVHAPRHVRVADDRFFEMAKARNDGQLSLMRTLEGPQDIELDLTMTVYSKGFPAGTNVVKLLIMVSEYSF